APAAATSRSSATATKRPVLDRAVLTLALPLARDTLPRFLELGVDQLGPEGAHVLVGDAPGAVEEERLRDAPDAIVDGDPVPGVDPVRVGHAELPDERTRLVLGVLDVDAEEHDVVTPVLLPGRLAVARFRRTRLP